MAEVTALRSRLPRRKKRTAAATPSRVAKRRGGQARSVLEALMAGDDDENDNNDNERQQGGGFSRQTPQKGDERVKSAQKRKRRRKERQRMKRRMKSAGAEEADEPAAELEPVSENESEKENVPLGGNNQAHADDSGRERSDGEVDPAGSDSNQDDSDASDDEAPGNDGGGSPVIQKRLFSSNQSTSSEESDVASDSVEGPIVDEVEEQRNYHRFVTKYAAAATTSVLEAVTPRDEKKKARRAGVNLPSPVQEADESVLSQSRGREVQYRDTDDEMDDEDWQAEIIPQDDDDKHDPTYAPGSSDRRASLRSAKKKPRPKAEKTVKTDRKTPKAGARALGDTPSASADESTDADTALKSEKRRRRTRSTVLTNWSVEWPLQTSATTERKSRDLRLVLVGEVDGKSARFQVAKRFTATHFTSSTDESVVLEGPFNANAAAESGELPPGFVELMRKGIPAHWKRHLTLFVPGGLSPPAKTKTKRTSESRERGMHTSKAVKGASRGKEATEPMTPVMKWWRADASAGKASDSPSVKKSTATKEASGRTNEKKAAAKKPPLAKRSAAVAAKSKKESIAEPDDWTAEQLEALEDAKLKIPTTAPNFWAEVASFVPGKTSNQCRARSFAQFSTPPERKSNKGKKRALDASESRVPAKVARAGTNKFKKQVREFVEEYEKKNMDDIFAEQETPVKAPALAMDFDSLTSPTIVTPQKADSSERDGDESEDAPTPGLLTKLTASKRDDVDSYVLGIKRRHTGIAIGAKAVRTSGLSTPSVVAAKKKAMAVHMMAEVGTHLLEGVVSPGGTTRVRIGKDGSSSEEDEDDLDEDDEERSDLSDF